jgi:hypothetical protein
MAADWALPDVVIALPWQANAARAAKPHLGALTMTSRLTSPWPAASATRRVHRAIVVGA